MMRMSREQCHEILEKIEPYISKQSTVMGGHPISAGERLALTLRFLATGESFRSLHFQFRISRRAVSYIVYEVCKAIHDVLGAVYLKVPSTTQEWSRIACQFEERWNFPNCLGAVDGKHIVMQPPAGAGSHFYNYKHTHSVVLMAVAGPAYEILYADVGTNGRISDGGVWNKCSLLTAIQENQLGIPPAKPLPYGIHPLPFVFVGDDAFALKPFFMKPYPQQGLTLDKRVYNYRHSRARRISENLFGILANRWRVLRNILLLPPAAIENLVMAILTLHNFLRQGASKEIYCPSGLLDEEDPATGTVRPGFWRQENNGQSLLSLTVPRSGHNASRDAKEIRDSFKDYFFCEGAVDWQWNMCM